MSSPLKKYTICRIPHESPHKPDFVTKFRDTKLAALAEDPTGFAVQHADEILLPLDVWRKRLAPPATVLICVKTSNLDTGDTSNEEILLSGEWVGMVTSIGPLPYSLYHIPGSGQPVPEDPDRETRWHVCNLYTSPTHRGHRLGAALVDACADVARERTIKDSKNGDKTKARLRLFCNPKKTFLVKLYRGMGFQEAGNVTLRDGFVANGDEALLPEDTSSTEEKRGLWETRYGLAMERVIDV
jgi:ribosomal protein S18 acetylase RimI-like enzyme